MVTTTIYKDSNVPINVVTLDIVCPNCYSNFKITKITFITFTSNTTGMEAIEEEDTSPLCCPFCGFNV